MRIKNRMSGNEALGQAIRQINPDVMPAFPITPSTEIPQFVSNMIANGEVTTHFIPVESEHSAMSASLGSEAAGCRTITATSSCGLALMWEELYVAASSRLPIAMCVVNRGLTGPLNINAEHSDSMGARDSGWIQIYAENNQEVYDNMLQAHRICEHEKVRLPIMICQDGFITSHAVQNIVLEDDAEVKAFVGEYKPEHYLLKANETMALGPYANSPYCMEAKRAQAEGMIQAKQVILDVAKDFEKMTGRKYGFFEEYKLADADYAVVAIGSAAGTMKDAVDKLREKGIKAGLLKVRVFRPFPGEEMAKALENCKAVAVMDKADSLNAAGGPLFTEVASAMLVRGVTTPKVINYIYGLGGTDVKTTDIETVYNRLLDIASTGNVGETYNYLGI